MKTLLRKKTLKLKNQIANLPVQLFDEKSQTPFNDVSLWKTVASYLQGEASAEEIELELERLRFTDNATSFKEAGGDMLDFYRQYKSSINKNSQKKRIFLEVFNIPNDQQLKKKVDEAFGYPEIFYDPDFRQDIIEEQGKQCALCGRDLNGIYPHLHHINYNKKDCDKGNLVFLCPRCHGKTNHQRHIWQSILEEYKHNYEVFSSD